MLYQAELHPEIGETRALADPNGRQEQRAAQCTEAAPRLQCRRATTSSRGAELPQAGQGLESVTCRQSSHPPGYPAAEEHVPAFVEPWYGDLPRV